jgi:uroporphyrinogen-III decarboxylase
MGLERFLFMLNDYKKETVDLMDIMSEKYRKCYEIYSKTAIEAILIPEDASTTLYSPEIFNKYFKPTLKEYCRIIKDSGKIAIIHACGHLKGLANYLGETGANCIESVSPPPTGNIGIDELKKLLPDFCIMGGISANHFLLDLNDFKEFVKVSVLTNKKRRNFIFSSGDSVPRDAKIDNLKIIPELVMKYGQY